MAKELCEKCGCDCTDGKECRCPFNARCERAMAQAKAFTDAIQAAKKNRSNQ